MSVCKKIKRNTRVIFFSFFVFFFYPALSAVAAGPWAYSCTVQNGTHNWYFYSFSITQYPGTSFHHWINGTGPNTGLASVVNDNQPGSITAADAADIIRQLPQSANHILGNPGGFRWKAIYDPRSVAISSLQLWQQIGGYTPQEAGWQSVTVSGNNGIIFTISGNDSNFEFAGEQFYQISDGNITLTSGPKNQYLTHTFSINLGPVVTAWGETANGTPPYPSWGGDKSSVSPGASPVITCSRAADSLSLSMGESTVSFGTVQSGDNLPVNRSLSWSASGSGRAGVWTLTFKPAATDSSGKYISLGGAKVSVLDSVSQLVPLNQPVNISGTSGSYTLSLDPVAANPGPQSVNLNITLTAN
ncbi:hypothetical protein [Citrobacter arsenatis]|uniref:hypothetical protein n=1 Tax=Citrobacter arsenatis TaxID=2546350 RepID=UPI00300E022D